ncbi:hypothetical protein [Embleya scabrispora]|uniref:hypothetical protein n=1 Tax=Embleya scabrispora TaxID=159449 RepID=UPI00037B8EBA|nr:hypothetical protein [Embleya scabrispora]MYS80337.1 hypothetical protein [Streptomyces sp. SID5474]
MALTAPLFIPRVPPFFPPPAPRRRFVHIDRTRARNLMRDVGNGPLPEHVQLVQAQTRERLRVFLAEAGFRHHRLYVLEVASRHPRVKIGVSKEPYDRIARHISEYNRWQHALIRVHVTDPLPDRLTARRAEVQAHTWMDKHFTAPHSREEFMDGDYVFGKICADTAVSVLTQDSDVRC